MAAYLFLLLGVLICSSSAIKCPVCQDDACDKPEEKTCVENGQGNPTPPPIIVPTTSPTTTTTEDDGSGNGEVDETARLVVDGNWNDNEGFLFPSKVEQDTPKQRQVRQIYRTRDVRDTSFGCLDVEFTTKDNVTHVQQYCVDSTKENQICKLYKDAVGESNVSKCKVSIPNSAASYSLRNLVGIVLFTIAGRVLI